MTSRSPDLFERYMTQSHTSPDQERFSISPDFSHRIHEKVFCTENNVEQCIAYLNQVCRLKNVLYFWNMNIKVYVIVWHVLYLSEFKPEGPEAMMEYL